MQIQSFIQQVAIMVPSTFVSLSIWRSIVPIRKDIFHIHKFTMPHLPTAYFKKLSLAEMEIKSRIDMLFPVTKHREHPKDLKSVPLYL
jgi:hypothetical protein